MDYSQQMTISEGEVRILFALTLVIAGLSALCCLSLCLTGLIFPSRREFPRDILLYLSLSTLCQSLSFLLTLLPNSNFLCTLQGFLLELFSFSSLCWFAVESLILYVIIARQGTFSSLRPFRVYFHLFAWIIPIIPSVAVLLLREYQDSGMWCWIVKPLLQMTCFYGPMLILLVFAFFSVISSVWRIGRTRQQVFLASHNYVTKNTFHQSARRRLLFFIFAFAVIWTFGAADRIYEMTHNGKSVMFVKLMHVFAAPGQGILVFLSLGLTGGNIRVWKERFCKQNVRNEKNVSSWSMERRRGYESRLLGVSGYHIDDPSDPDDL